MRITVKINSLNKKLSGGHIS